ncbi:MAG: DUF4139 domain-containing protein [Myxococcota bacterium]|nr:DUF4139 domain-containing protein [Myxococcota bacterium]
MSGLSRLVLALSMSVMAVACTNYGQRPKYPAASSPLKLDRVVLYRNGIGYFERQGVIRGDILTLKVRKDQINDLLKSLTVVDRSSGKALSISIPLSPDAWQSVALSTLSPGSGSLAEVLDGLRGTRITVTTTEAKKASGRIAMVERININHLYRANDESPPEEDFKLTLLDDETASVVRLSEIKKLSIHDKDLVMQLHRRLDASSGEGMFKQVLIDIRLDNNGPHDLVVSYVAEAPLWKPTYRIVLSDDESQEALLQSWAVVDNTSGENWADVDLSLTSGAPIAFQYDLHTPRHIQRPDLSERGLQKQARVAVGETTMEEEIEASEAAGADAAAAELQKLKATRSAKPRSAPKREKAAEAFAVKDEAAINELRGGHAPAPPGISMGTLQSSVTAKTTSKQVAGLTQFDLENRVTLPDGSATMVALINQKIQGEQTFLYRPGGSGSGYEYNPYRVVRFNNDTEFVLEPGPISIYAGGSFVGEGLSEAVAAKANATIPFAVEPRIVVRSQISRSSGETKLLKVVAGVLHTESFNRVETTWKVTGMKQNTPYKVLIRHPRQGSNYDLFKPKENVETLTDAYFIPIRVGANKTKASVNVIEQTPSRTTLSIWDGQAVGLLDTLLSLSFVTDDMRAKIKPIIDLRQEIGRIDTEIRGLKAQQHELDQRLEDTRKNLKAIKKDPKATALRKKLGNRLDEFSAEAAKIGRKIVALNSKRLEKKIELEDLLKDFTIIPKN